jgi:hypothetical protein
MDLGLKEIIITIMLGAYTLLGLEIILFALFRLRFKGFFRDTLGFDRYRVPRNTSPYPMKIAVFIGLSFGVGIVAEDLSYKFVDNELPFGLLSRYDSRVKSLIGDIESPAVNPLAKELALNGAFRISAENPEESRRTEAWILSGEPYHDPCAQTPEHCFVKHSIIDLYYQAKNTVYTNPNYYDELKRIQARSDFTRSIAIIGFFYWALIPVLLLFLLAVRVYARRHRLRIVTRDASVSEAEDSNVIVAAEHERKNRQQNLVRVHWASRRSFELSRAKFTTALELMGALTVIILLSGWAYTNETREFNKRAFGYFSTGLATSRVTKLKTDDLGVSKSADNKPSKAGDP